jgi:hypothetical protein
MNEQLASQSSLQHKPIIYPPFYTEHSFLLMRKQRQPIQSELKIIPHEANVVSRLDEKA